MSLKDKMKSYNFWISLASAIVLIVRIVGEKFNFIVDTSLLMDITTALCSVFVILGILSVPKTTSSKVETENNIIKIEDVKINENMNVSEDRESGDSSATNEENIAIENNETISNNLIIENPAEATDKNTEMVEVKTFDEFKSLQDVVVGTYKLLNPNDTNKETNISAIIAELKSNIDKASSIIKALCKED